MNYDWHYNRLIETRKLMNREKNCGVYYETHHIVMRSMGGTDDLSNLVNLTAREHFLAHWLLKRMFENDDQFRECTSLAFRYMSEVRSGTHEAFQISSIAYAEAKEANSRVFAERNRVMNTWEKMTTDQKAKRRQSMNPSKAATSQWKGKNEEARFDDISGRWSKGWQNLTVEERSARAKRTWEIRRKNKLLKEQNL